MLQPLPAKRLQPTKNIQQSLPCKVFDRFSNIFRILDHIFPILGKPCTFPHGSHQKFLSRLHVKSLEFLLQPFILNALLLWHNLRRRGLYQAEPGWWRWLARIALGLLAMAAAVLAVRGWVGEWTALTVPWRWIWLLAAVAAGAGAYGLVMLATGLRLRHLRGP